MKNHPLKTRCSESRLASQAELSGVGQEAAVATLKENAELALGAICYAMEYLHDRSSRSFVRAKYFVQSVA